MTVFEKIDALCIKHNCEKPSSCELLGDALSKVVLLIKKLEKEIEELKEKKNGKR